MIRTTDERHKRIIAIWLLIGVFMIILQILLGGITRLTGSGLSITEWAPIMGTIPPLNHEDWLVVFDKYQQTPQYQHLNSSITLSEFKIIFFWEWFHRLWARALGVVFLIPFIFLLVKKWFTKEMIRPMIILFLLGAAQGLIGWIMVASGLTDDNVSVDHYKLAVHFISALVLLCYTLWFALTLIFSENQKTYAPKLRRYTVFVLVILTIQLFYGAFAAGLHAALAASTWPGVNGQFFPTLYFGDDAWWYAVTSNRINIQWIHRGLAYFLTILLVIWWWKSKKTKESLPLARWAFIPIILVLVQITLGILTVLNSTSKIPVTWAVLHQFNGMLLLMSIFIGYFFLAKKSPEVVVK